MRAAAWVGLFCGLGLTASAAADEATVASLLKSLPESTNTVAVFRVDEILKSPRAIQGKWAEKQAEAFLDGSAVIPPRAKAVVRGMQVYPEDPAPAWSLSLIALSGTGIIQQIARAENTDVTLVSGRSAVQARGNCFYVDLGKGVLATISPAYRQRVAKVVHFAANSEEVRISETLQQALAANKSHIVLAVDLTDMLDPRAIRWHLGQALIVEKPQQVEPLVAAIAGLKTIQFDAKIGTDITSHIRLDFGKKLPEALVALVKPAFLHALGDLGAELEDFQQATVTQDGTSVVLETKLSDAELRRVLTLVMAPTPATEAPPATADTAKPTTNIQSTERYFRSVNSLLEDLQKKRARDYAKTALWHETFAKKIDQLPITGVDPEVLDYGARTANSLRGLAASLKGIPVKIDTLNRAVTYEVQVQQSAVAVGYGGYAGYSPGMVGFTSNTAQIREQQAAAINAGEDQRNQIWNQIESERSEVRRKMLMKYEVDIDAARK